MPKLPRGYNAQAARRKHSHPSNLKSKKNQPLLNPLSHKPLLHNRRREGRGCSCVRCQHKQSPQNHEKKGRGMRPAEDEHDVARLHAVADAMEIPELKPQALR